jgi:hypothetical protein
MKVSHARGGPTRLIGDGGAAVVRPGCAGWLSLNFVLQVKKPQQGDRQFRAVGCSTAEKIRGAAVVISSVPGAEPGAADAVRGGDAG